MPRLRKKFSTTRKPRGAAWTTTRTVSFLRLSSTLAFSLRPSRGKRRRTILHETVTLATIRSGKLNARTLRSTPFPSWSVRSLASAIVLRCSVRMLLHCQCSLKRLSLITSLAVRSRPRLGWTAAASTHAWIAPGLLPHRWSRHRALTHLRLMRERPPSSFRATPISSHGFSRPARRRWLPPRL